MRPGGWGPDALLRLGGEDGFHPFLHVLDLPTRGTDSPDPDKHPALGVTDVQRHPALILPLAPAVPMLLPARHHALPISMVYHNGQWAVAHRALRFPGQKGKLVERRWHTLDACSEQSRTSNCNLELP